MTMHLVGPYLTTTSYKKPKEKITKAKQEELERGWKERNIRLREMGLPKETFEQYVDWVYGRGKKEKKKEKVNSSTSATNAKVSYKGSEVFKPNAPISGQDKKEEISSDNKETIVPKSLGQWITGPVSSKQTPAYTGTKVKGIGTMHKSNAVPIFSDEEAIDISRMRR